jgi:hypothetical protein
VDYNVQPWPQTSLIHELSSIVYFLGQYSKHPPEMRIREIESAFQRPMIQITPISSRVANRSRYDFTTYRTVALTYFGSSDRELSATKRQNEMFIVTDWLTESLSRGAGINGPAIQVYDFSTTEPTPTGIWMDVEQAVVEPIMDQYGLWTIPVDLRYGVDKPESEWYNRSDGSFTTPVQITDLKWRVEIKYD